MKEHLDSDRVNFLIWRYLIEGNYRETAVKFQKEWHVEAPQRDLDFASHVKSHALVNVLNKGLLYNALEREYAHSQQQQVPQDAALPENLQLGIFGPLDSQRSHQRQEQAARDDDRTTSAPAVSSIPAFNADIENSKKRQIDRQQQAPLTNGSPAKRQRLSNGYENGDTATADLMEVDGQNGDNHAYPSPMEGEQAPTPTPRTDGPEQSTQVDKVEELASETIFVSLAPNDEPLPSSPLNGLSKNGTEAAPVLLHCQWNPRDPTILAGAGTDALARIWTVGRGGVGSDADTRHVNGGGMAPKFHNLVDEEVPPKATVTAMAWNGDGTAIAIATDSDEKGRLTLWSADGTHLHHFEVPEPPIFKIRWNPNNAAILGIAPDNGGTLITVYHAETSNTLSYLLKDHDIDDQPLDATWTSETEFLICGGELLMSLRCTDQDINESQKFETRAGDNLSQIQFDWVARIAATCSEKGFIEIWDAKGKRREIEAHCNQVTALAWQPANSMPASGERLLASGGEDGAICIWNAMAQDGKPTCTMTMGLPIVALSFTPDGAFIAGATSEKIYIWKVGDHSMPRASWSRGPHPGWSSPKMNMDTDSEVEDEHCLGWDSTGHKLAYGVNSRLAVINFR